MNNGLSYGKTWLNIDDKCRIMKEEFMSVFCLHMTSCFSERPCKVERRLHNGTIYLVQGKACN